MEYPKHEEKIYTGGKDELGEFPNLPELLPNFQKNKPSNPPLQLTYKEKATSEIEKSETQR